MTAHCCHDPKAEPCAYGWTDTHFHRCADSTATPPTTRTDEESQR